MGIETQLAALQIEVEKAVALAALGEAIQTAAWMLMLYFVIKAAIREGLKESGLIDELRRANRKGSNAPVEPSFMRDR